MNENQEPCEDCAQDWDVILTADAEACSDCYHLLPSGIQNLWERRWKQEDKWYSEWLHEL